MIKFLNFCFFQTPSYKYVASLWWLALLISNSDSFQSKVERFLSWCLTSGALKLHMLLIAAFFTAIFSNFLTQIYWESQRLQPV